MKRTVGVLSVVYFLLVVFAGSANAIPLVNVPFEGRLYSLEEEELAYSGYFTTTYNPQRHPWHESVEFDILYYKIEISETLLQGDSGVIKIWPQDIIIHLNGLACDAEVWNIPKLFELYDDDQSVFRGLEVITIHDFFVGNGWPDFDSYGSPALWYTDDRGVDFFASDIQHIGAPYPSPIPEPSTILLVAIGLIGLAGFGKKFKK